MAPEHPYVEEITTDAQKADVEAYKESCLKNQAVRGVFYIGCTPTKWIHNNVAQMS